MEALRLTPYALRLTPYALRLHLYSLCRVLHCLDYFLITRAPADVRRYRVYDLFLRRFFVAVEERFCGHYHAGCTETALHGSLFHECLLQRDEAFHPAFKPSIVAYHSAVRLRGQDKA